MRRQLATLQFWHTWSVTFFALSIGGTFGKKVVCRDIIEFLIVDQGSFVQVQFVLFIYTKLTCSHDF